MGKRELLLILAFAVVGVVLYEVTAPPLAPGQEGFSLSRIVQNMRRAVQGSRESASADWHQVVSVDPEVSDLQINLTLLPSDLTITGEDTADVTADMHVTARGFDQAEAKNAASGAHLKIERAGSALVVTFQNTAIRGRGSRNGFMQQMGITLKVPRRLQLRVQPHAGRLLVSGVAALDVMGSRGETRVKNIAGAASLTQSGRDLEIDDVASLKLNGRSSEGTIRRVGGIVSVQAVGGDLQLGDLTGPVDIDSRNTDLRLDQLKNLKPPLQLNTVGGTLRIDGLRSEARIDARDTELQVTLDAPAPVTIYSTSEDIVVTPPPGGYTIDALATDGRIAIEDGTVRTEGTDNDQRASGAVRGGGPTLMLRATRAGINVRARPAVK